MDQKAWARFIPAGAGNTQNSRNRRLIVSVYPRWRGEHITAGERMSVKPGLSPLARGTQVLFARITSGARFIPAGAGNTSGAPAVHGCDTVYPRSAVYPRWRGEHTLRHCCGCSHTGLSPLARGTRFRPGSSDPRGRFIPAGAGNTTSGKAPTLSGPVYPRWRGEHIVTTAVWH